MSTIDVMQVVRSDVAMPTRVDPPAQTERRVLEARAESRRAIESILDALGYAGDLAEGLERAAWANDHTWRVATSR